MAERHPAIVTPYAKTLTKYERTQVIGMRAEQLARGAQPFVQQQQQAPEGSAAAASATTPAAAAVAGGGGSGSGVYDVAERELDERRLPFVVVRTLPNGKTDQVRTS
jgi:DNA-directed RNA polymerase subunit K/omega